MYRSGGRALSPSARVTVVGVEHARLLYLYLDRGDQDGCASLLDERVHVRFPGMSAVRGREGGVALAAGACGTGRHRVRGVIAEGVDMAVTGVFQDGNEAEKDFVDIFTISDCGLLISWRRFYDASRE